jgi:hypothetical protein
MTRPVRNRSTQIIIAKKKRGREKRKERNKKNGKKQIGEKRFEKP